MPQFSPAFDDIVFYDAEFTSLNPYTGEILSVGMIKPSGEELYFEIEPKGELSEWDKKHVLPYLKGAFISREEAKTRITEFLGKEQSHLVCFVPQYDMIFLHKLFSVGDGQQDALPYHWMPVDFASILFSLGIHPHLYSDENPELFASWGIDPEKYQKHNALSDAKLLKEVYQRLSNKAQGVSDK